VTMTKMVAAWSVDGWSSKKCVLVLEKRTEIWRKKTSLPIHNFHDRRCVPPLRDE
jgi:hypothetical protein